MKSTGKARAAAGLMAISMGLAACTGAMRQGTSKTEVLTLTEVSEDKMMITMRMGDGMNYEAMETAIESSIPDVDIVIRSNSPVAMTAVNHDSEDIVLFTGSEFAAADMEDAFIDLSGESFVQNYYLSTLQAGEIDGKLYFLPGPSNIYGIVYNKDMFRENGWEVPDNLDEFIKLCQQIESAGIRALQPSLYFTDAASQFFTGFTYQPTLAGTENEKWFSDYKKGEAVMPGHMEPAFDILDRLLEAGVLKPGDFQVQPSARSDMMYIDQSCAMILETQSAIDYAKERAGEDVPEIGLMPFFSGPDEDSDYFLSVPLYNTAISKALEQKGQEEKYKKVKDILEYLSTSDGQKAVMGENTSVISSVKGIERGENEFLKDAEDTIEKGHVVPQAYFAKYGGTDFIKAMKEGLQSYAEGTLTREQFMEQLDKARDGLLQNNAAATVKVGTAKDTFTILQTACLLGDIFRAKTDAQIALCGANTRIAGNNWKIYKGDIQYEGIGTLDRYLDISFLKKKSDEENEGKLLKVKMTGENILETLNSQDIKKDNFQEAYFTASGLDITFAPWAGDGNRYLSVKLKDGKELEPEKEYTVAFWNGAVNQDLVGSVIEEYDVRVADLLKDWIQDQGGTIQPENDHFTLDWKTVE